MREVNKPQYVLFPVLYSESLIKSAMGELYLHGKIELFAL